MRFEWPGNVRSLKHACERAAILTQGEQYQFADFGLITAPNNVPGAPTMPQTMIAAYPPAVDSIKAPASSSENRSENREIAALKAATVQTNLNSPI